MTGLMSLIDTEKFEKIARLQYAGVSETDIAGATGLTVGRISQIYGEDKYKEVYGKIVAEKFDLAEETGNTWDEVENAAIKVVKATLGWSHDPEYALKAAMVANKAQRRNSLNIPISANAGARAIIQLGDNYVTQVLMPAQTAAPGAANGTNGTNGAMKVVEQKQTDLASPTRVEELFNKKTVAVDAAMEIVDGLRTAGFGN